MMMNVVRSCLVAAILLGGPVLAQQPTGQDMETYYRQAARYASFGRYGEALTCYQSALSLAQRTYGPSDERGLTPLEKIYETHVRLQNWSAAELDRRQALQIIDFCHGKDDPVPVARERVRLASFLAERQRYPECEAMYRQAIDSVASDPIAASNEGPGWMAELANVLRIDEKPKEADQWEARARRIRTNRFDH